jgi:hypothetical protein
MTLPAFKAGQATVCHQELASEHGVSYRYFVRLPDGYVAEMGSGRSGDKRAQAVADAINVMMKWASEFPPVGVVEQIVRMNFRDEDRRSSESGEH